MAGIGTFQVVDVADSTTVLFDLNDPTGLANPGGLKTIARELRLGAPELDAVRLDSGTRPGARTIFARDPLVATSWRQSIQGSATDAYDELTLAVGELARLLRRGGRIKLQPTGSANVRYLDFEPSAGPPVFGEAPEDTFRALTSHRFPEGIEIAVWRHPYLLGPQLDPTVNKVPNPTLLRSRTVAGRPDLWSWSATSNIAAEAIEALTESYRFDVTSTTTRTLFPQTTVAAPGQVWSGHFEGQITGVGRLKARIEFLDAADAVLATQDTTAFATPAAFARVSVTTAAAPASTAKARLSILVSNSASGTATYRVRRAQLEEAAAPSLFVCGPEVVAADPIVGYGRTFPVWVHGDVPAAAVIEVTVESGKPASLLVGTRPSGGDVGGRRLADYLNGAAYVAAEGATALNGAEVMSDAEASGGAGVAAGGARHRQLVAATFAATSNPSISWPAATATKSLRMLMVLVHDDTTTVTTPAGYSARVSAQLIGNTAGAGGRLWIFDRPGTSVDSGAVALTLSASASGMLQLAEWPGTGALTGLGTAGGTGTAISCDGGPDPAQTYEIALSFVVWKSTSATISDETPTWRKLAQQTGTTFRTALYESYPGNTRPLGFDATLSAAVRFTAKLVHYQLVATGGWSRFLRKEITAVDALVGTLQARVRARVYAPARIGLQLRWGTSTADACDRVGVPITHDATPALMGSVSYVERSLGKVVVPADAAALVLEVWGKGDPIVGTGFVLDGIALEPATPESESSSTLAVGLSSERFAGSEFVYVSGAGTVTPVGDEAMVTNAVAALPPLAGTDLPVARHTYWLSAGENDISPDFVFKITNVTDAVDAASVRVTEDAVIVTKTGPMRVEQKLHEPLTVGLSFDALAGKQYVVQVDTTGMPLDTLPITSLEHRVHPAIGIGDVVTTDPASLEASRRDGAGKVIGALQVAGGVPAWLGPGLNLLRLAFADVVPDIGYTDEVSRLGALPSVRVTYAPAWLH